MGTLHSENTVGIIQDIQALKTTLEWEDKLTANKTNFRNKQTREIGPEFTDEKDDVIKSIRLNLITKWGCTCTHINEKVKSPYETTWRLKDRRKHKNA